MSFLTSSPRHPVLGLVSLLSVHSPHRKRAFPFSEFLGTLSPSHSIPASLVSFKLYLLLTSSSGNSSRKSTTPVSGGTPPSRARTNFAQRLNLSIGVSVDLILSGRDAIEAMRSATLWQMEISRSGERTQDRGSRGLQGKRDGLYCCTCIHGFCGERRTRLRGSEGHLLFVSRWTKACVWAIFGFPVPT